MGALVTGNSARGGCRNSLWGGGGGREGGGGCVCAVATLSATASRPRNFTLTMIEKWGGGGGGGGRLVRPSLPPRTRSDIMQLVNLAGAWRPPIKSPRYVSQVH